MPAVLKLQHHCNHQLTAQRSRKSVRVFASIGNGYSLPKKTIQQLIETHGTILLPGCYDALSAKVLEQTGHVGGYISGAAVAATQLGEPDVGLLTPPEMARKTSQIAGIVPDLPVISDADAGGGTILNVQRTIRSLMAAGAKGCVLEDQVWPRKIGYMRSKEVVHPEEFVAKLLAAREVIGTSDFFVIARTDARGTSAKHGLDDAIARANLYIDAGADAHLVGGLRSLEEQRAVGERTQGLRVASLVEGGMNPLTPKSQLSSMGFHIVIYPLAGLYAATRAMMDVYQDLAANGSSEESWENMVSWRAFNSILGLEEKLQVEDHFTQVKGPASNIDGGKLRVKVKGLVKPVHVN